MPESQVHEVLASNVELLPGSDIFRDAKVPLVFLSANSERLALNDGEQDDDDEEEERQIKEDAINLVGITVRSTDLITCTRQQSSLSYQ